MKLASLKHGRDGRLVVVSADLTRYAEATHIAPTLQAALDSWRRVQPRLETLAREIELGSIPTERFREKDCAAPLPRAYQWLSAAAYGRADDPAASALGGGPRPARLRQLASDRFYSPRDPVTLPAGGGAYDIGAGVAAILGDVRQGAEGDLAGQGVRLLMLVNEASIVPGETSPDGRGIDTGMRPPASFSPVCVAPEALDGWDGARLRGVLSVRLNGRLIGRLQTEVGMTYDFPALIAAAARLRPLTAGTIIGSGPASNPGPGGLVMPVEEGGPGVASVRRLPAAPGQGAQAGALLLSVGDRVEIEMLDARGRSVFGRIEHVLEG
jgi:fumarylacetoacetate (FAA) hydrolase